MDQLDVVGLCGSLSAGSLNRMADQTTRKFVGDQMASFRQWIHAVRRMRAGEAPGPSEGVPRTPSVRSSKEAIQ